MPPLISICIPAFERENNLRRLLDSIVIQDFKDFEVIITDDSQSTSLQEMVKTYNNRLPIQYFKNERQYNTPANWNLAISKASGSWIKLMHDDDWFASPDSLSQFAQASTKNKKFILSFYYNVYHNTDRSDLIKFTDFAIQKIIPDPLLLLVHNIIGPPSTTLVHSSILTRYDEALKWRVDIDFYIRILLEEKDLYIIKNPLICVGMSLDQVTYKVKNKPEVEIPEAEILFRKYGVESLRHLIIYDVWWRLFRNMDINSYELLNKYRKAVWPVIIKNLLKDLSRIPSSFLKIGLVSKFFMTISYLKNYHSIK